MKETLETMRRRLGAIYPRGEAEAMIRLIFEVLKGWRPVDIVLNEDKPLSDYMKGKVKDVLDRSESHEPIQYILGTARFFGLDFSVRPGVLVPRPETEGLVQLVLDTYGDTPDLNILDAGTGSGCIACALARNLRFPKVTAIDESAGALEVARQNALLLKCKVDFKEADILSLKPTSTVWDAIVSNPPYIVPSEKAQMEANVLDWEPERALFVPEGEPLLFYKALARYGKEALKPGGYLFFEINPLFVHSLCGELTGMGYADVAVYKDIHGRDRYARAKQTEL